MKNGDLHTAIAVALGEHRFRQLGETAEDSCSRMASVVLSIIEEEGFILISTKAEEGKQTLPQIVEDAMNDVRTALGALLEVKDALRTTEGR